MSKTDYVINPHAAEAAVEAHIKAHGKSDSAPGHGEDNHDTPPGLDDKPDWWKKDGDLPPGWTDDGDGGFSGPYTDDD